MTLVRVVVVRNIRSAMGSKNPKNQFFAGGFLYNPDTQEVLLHLRDGNTTINPHKWGIFGGTSEGDESPEECCVREWREELGIDIEVTKLIPLRTNLTTKSRTWRHIFYLESRLTKQQMTLGEGAGFDWIPMTVALNYDLTNSTREDLEYFFSIIETQPREKKLSLGKV